MELLSILLLVFPLLGFLTLGIMQKRIAPAIGGVLASAMVFINFLISCTLFAVVRSSGQSIEVSLFDWIQFGDIHIPFALTVDRLSALMLLIINGVGLLIHVYSIGYMKDDDGFNRFFAYLNLFCYQGLFCPYKKQEHL